MASDETSDLPPSFDAPSASTFTSTTVPQYTEPSRESTLLNDDAATLPPPYTPNPGVDDSEVDANYSTIVGKQSVWYHGSRYSTDELWKAAASRNFSTIQKCLKAGLSVNYCRWCKDDTFGHGVRSIADIVAGNNDLRSMRLLIEHKADLTGAVVSIFTVNKQSEARMIYDRGELELLENDMWTTPLHEACRKGHVDMISILLEEGGVNPHTMDNRQRTGLFIATKSRQTVVVQRLLLSGAAIESEVSGGITPLAAAAYAGSTDIVDLLLQSGAKVDIADDRGETALYNAALMGHHDIVTRLVAFGADVNVRNLADTSAFFTAASRFKRDTMAVLIDCGADTDIPDSNGCTALLRAVMAKNIPLLKLLLDMGADIDTPDDRGWTPLFAAMIHNDELLIRLLLDNGCNTSTPDLHGNTPLHQAAMLNSVMVVRSILARPQQPIDHSQVNAFGETPLTLASKYNHSGMVKILLKHGADPSFADPEDHTALDRALYHGNHASVRHLLTHNPDQITQLTLQSLQAGRLDNAHLSNAKYDMIMQTIRGPQGGYTVIPKLEPVNAQINLKSRFALAITRDELRARMRLKQRRPVAVNPDTGMVSAQAQRESIADPFEACIPKVASSASLRRMDQDSVHGLSAARAGIAATNLAVNVASFALGI